MSDKVLSQALACVLGIFPKVAQALACVIPHHQVNTSCSIFAD